MRTWIKTAAALALAAGLVSAQVAPASADHDGAGFAAGLATGILGMGLLHAVPPPPPPPPYYYGVYDDPRCRPGRLECRTFAPPCYTSEWGEYVCPPPARRCFRRPVCY
jgi:hypothetical protein